MKPNKLTFERHVVLGKTLKRMRETLVHISCELGTTYPVGYLKAEEFLSRATDLIDNARSNLEDRMYEEYPEHASTYIYYPIPDMYIYYPSPDIWHVKSLKSGYSRVTSLFAYWEIALDPISDYFTPQEKSAEELFAMWVSKVTDKYADGFIPIYWFVRGRTLFEYMPFQHHRPRADFLTYFSWPVNKKTGERLNWLSLKVVEKLWDDTHCDKGGFIQQVTGWKPGILQPYVDLKSLIDARG
jgi:hypothetical protein